MYPLLLILLFSLPSVIVASFSSSDLIRNTTYGPVQGYSNPDDNVNLWLGIPYAAPPVGNLRWKIASPPQKWSQVRNATKTPTVCSQIRDDKLIGSEDCLYLNIYAPTNSSFSGPLPVMFFIYGGGFNSGDSYLFGYYNGSNLATTQGVIVVTHNYRVNSFGFLALKELAAETSDGTTGNYGVQDQRFALQWVIDNIANFGGNPKDILIFGESAGAFSVCFHLASEKSFGLYQAAMAESTTCDSIDFYREYDDAVSFSVDFATGFGCDRNSFASSQDYLACLRAAPAEQIIFAQATGTGFRPRFAPTWVWGPAIDGTASGLRDFPVYQVMKGDWAKVPTAAGFNRDEGSVFLFSIPTVLPNITLPLNEIEVREIIDFFWPNYKREILSLYPSSDYKSPDAQTAAILRDYVFSCAERRLLDATSDQSYPSYMYHVIYDSEFIETKVVGIYHGYELAFVFDNQIPPNIHEFSESDAEVAHILGYYWGNLAKTGDPNYGYYGQVDPTIPTWPAYNSSQKLDLLVDLPFTSETFPYNKACDMWDQVFAEETGGRAYRRNSRI